MAIPLRYNTASQEIPLGQFVDSGDGDTEEPSLTIANTDIKLWKAGATSLVSKNSGGATYMSNGVYYAVLDATDSNTVGPLVVFVHVSGALAVRIECVVYPQQVYDSNFAGTDTLQVHATEMSASLLTDTVFADSGANRLADHVLRRSAASARASSYGDTVGFRSLLGAVSKLVNRLYRSGSNLITTEENDTTTFGTQAMTTSGVAEQITDLDTT